MNVYKSIKDNTINFKNGLRPLTYQVGLEYLFILESKENYQTIRIISQKLRCQPEEVSTWQEWDYLSIKIVTGRNRKKPKLAYVNSWMLAIFVGNIL